MFGETKLSPSSLDGACCCQLSVLQVRWQFSVPTEVSLVGAVVLVCRPLLLLAPLLPVRSLLLFCGGAQHLFLSVYVRCSVLWDVHECPMRQNYPLRPWTVLVAGVVPICCLAGALAKFLFLPKSRSLRQCRSFVECWLLVLTLASLLPVRSLFSSVGGSEMFGVLGCP